MTTESIFPTRRPINRSAVVNATVRETSAVEYEERVGHLRALLAQWQEFREPQIVRQDCTLASA